MQPEQKVIVAGQLPSDRVALVIVLTCTTLSIISEYRCSMPDISGGISSPPSAAVAPSPLLGLVSASAAPVAAPVANANISPRPGDSVVLLPSASADENAVFVPPAAAERLPLSGLPCLDEQGGEKRRERGAGDTGDADSADE